MLNAYFTRTQSHNFHTNVAILDPINLIVKFLLILLLHNLMVKFLLILLLHNLMVKFLLILLLHNLMVNFFANTVVALIMFKDGFHEPYEGLNRWVL